MAGASPPSERRLLVRLATPLVAAHAGNQLMGLVDTVMVGHLSTAALGGVGLGNALFFGLVSFGLGVVMGVDAPIAQAIGAGDPARARRAMWQGVRIGLGIGLVTTLLLALLPLLLEPVGVKPAVASECRHYVWARLANVIPFFLFVAQRSYLQAIGRTRAIVHAVVLGNLVNLVLDMILINGDEFLGWFGLPTLGIPRLGSTGAGLATTFVGLANVVVLGLAIVRVPTPEDPARRAREPLLERVVLRLGVPIGLHIFAEVFVFALANLIASRMSETASAAHQVAITLASFTFTMSLGIGAATSVRVGYHVGRGDTPAARRVGWDGVLLSLVVMGTGGVLFIAFGRGLASSFAKELDVIAIATSLLVVAAVFQLSDGIQCVLSGALRGAGDTRFTLWSNVVGHYVVGLPVSLLLGLVLGLGAPGLWWGLSAGLTVTAGMLTWRFHHLTRRAIARV